MRAILQRFRTPILLVIGVGLGVLCNEYAADRGSPFDTQKSLLRRAKGAVRSWLVPRPETYWVRAPLWSRLKRHDATVLAPLVPIMATEGLTPYEKAVEIRRWTYRNTDIADEFNKFEPEIPLHEGSIDENLWPALRDEGGHWCAGTAYILSQIYRELGYRSWVYSYGEKDLITHATTLVEVEGEIYLQDAYFNLSFADDDGRPLPFPAALSRLRAGIKLHIEQDDPSPRDVHSRYPVIHGWPAALEGTPHRVLGHDHYVVRVRTSIDDFVDGHPLVTPTQAFLHQRGLPGDLQFLLLFPYAVNDDSAYITDPLDSPLLALCQDIASGRLGEQSPEFIAATTDRRSVQLR